MYAVLFLVLLCGIARAEPPAKTTLDPKVIRPVASAFLCVYQEKRKEAMDEIAVEKKYARIGGAVSLAKLYALQQDVREADRYISEFRGLLKAWRISALSCQKVFDLTACIQGYECAETIPDSEVSFANELLRYFAEEGAE